VRDGKRPVAQSNTLRLGDWSFYSQAGDWVPDQDSARARKHGDDVLTALRDAITRKSLAATTTRPNLNSHNPAHPPRAFSMSAIRADAQSRAELTGRC
jgi:hypothetical protein